MTEPTDAEIDVMVAAYLGDCGPQATRVYSFARAVLAKWGTPAGAGEPDFYTACAWHEGGGEAGWIPLPGYSNETEHGVKHLVLEAARKEGYKGTAAGRLLELGWEIHPVYLTPQPTQAQAGAVPLYRLLQSGVDRIEAGDEFLSDDTMTWAIDPNGIFVGNIYGGHVLRPARRRIKGADHA